MENIINRKLKINLLGGLKNNPKIKIYVHIINIVGGGRGVKFKLNLRCKLFDKKQ